MQKMDTYALLRAFDKAHIPNNTPLLVHTSLRTFGYYEDTARHLADALIQYVAAKGCLIIPTLSYDLINSNCYVFNVKDTSSCIGFFSEYFRQLSGVKRSLHATHSVCVIGEQSNYFLRDHILSDTPCGVHSPFFKLSCTGGSILFIGCGLQPNTSMHAIEELFMPEYLLQKSKVSFTVIDDSGQKHIQKIRCHNFKNIQQRYDRLEHLLTYPAIRKFRILNTECFLVDIAEMWKTAREIFESDIYYFVDRESIE